MISERSTSMIFLNETTPYLYMSAGYPLWDSLLILKSLPLHPQFKYRVIKCYSLPADVCYTVQYFYFLSFVGIIKWL